MEVYARVSQHIKATCLYSVNPKNRLNDRGALSPSRPHEIFRRCIGANLDARLLDRFLYFLEVIDRSRSATGISHFRAQSTKLG